MALRSTKGGILVPDDVSDMSNPEGFFQDTSAMNKSTNKKGRFFRVRRNFHKAMNAQVTWEKRAQAKQIRQQKDEAARERYSFWRKRQFDKDRRIKEAIVRADGSVNHRMFRAAITRGLNLPEEVLRALFYEYDEDKSGEISIQEFQKALNAIGIPANSHMVQRLVQHLDADGSCSIDIDEWVAFFKEMESIKDWANKQLAQRRRQNVLRVVAYTYIVAMFFGVFYLFVQVGRAEDPEDVKQATTMLWFFTPGLVVSYFFIVLLPMLMQIQRARKQVADLKARADDGAWWDIPPEVDPQEEGPFRKRMSLPKGPTMPGEITGEPVVHARPAWLEKPVLESTDENTESLFHRSTLVSSFRQSMFGTKNSYILGVKWLGQWNKPKEPKKVEVKQKMTGYLPKSTVDAYGVKEVDKIEVLVSKLALETIREASEKSSTIAEGPRPVKQDSARKNKPGPQPVSPSYRSSQWLKQVEEEEEKAKQTSFERKQKAIENEESNPHLSPKAFSRMSTPKGRKAQEIQLAILDEEKSLKKSNQLATIKEPPGPEVDDDFITSAVSFNKKYKGDLAEGKSKQKKQPLALMDRQDDPATNQWQLAVIPKQEKTPKKNLHELVVEDLSDPDYDFLPQEPTFDHDIPIPKPKEFKTNYQAAEMGAPIRSFSPFNQRAHTKSRKYEFWYQQENFDSAERRAKQRMQRKAPLPKFQRAVRSIKDKERIPDSNVSASGQSVLMPLPKPMSKRGKLADRERDRAPH